MFSVSGLASVGVLITVSGANAGTGSVSATKATRERTALAMTTPCKSRGLQDRELLTL